MTIRIFAIDMDGTCLNSRNRIDPETIVMLYRAKQAGIEIVPTTGRSLSCLPHQLLPLTDLYRYIISSNGAVITDTETGRISTMHFLIEQPLHPLSEKACALALLQQHISIIGIMFKDFI